MIPASTIEFEFTPGTWTPATHRLRKPAGLNINRGRDSELQPVSAGECSFVLSNDDGCYTQGLAPSEVGRNLYPNPRLVASGTLTGVASRFTSSWTTAARTGVAPPVPGLTTAWRADCTASDPGIGRGMSLAGDPAEVTPGAGLGIATTPGATYVLSCYVRASKAATWQIIARFHTGAGAWSTTFLFSPVAPAAANVWVRVGVAVVAPSGGARLAFAVATSESVAWVSGDNLDVTGVQVESGAATDYHDGIYGPLDRTAAWVGTANASASTLTTIIYPTKRFVPVRVETSGRRFTGYVDSWSVSVQQRGIRSSCTVRAVDRMALDSLKALAAHTAEVVAGLSPMAYWDLTGELSGGNVPGGQAPVLIPRYAGASGGELGWGSGDAVAGDDAAGVRFTPAIDETTLALKGGFRLESTYSPPTSYSVIVTYGKSLQDGPLLRMGGVRIDVSGGVVFYVPPSGPSIPLTGNVEVLSVNGSGVVLSSDPSNTFYAQSSAVANTMIGGTMIGGTAVWSGASVSHVAVIPRVAPASQAALARRLSMSADSVETIIGRLLSLSGVGSATVIRVGSAQKVIGIPTAGQSVQAVIDQLAIGGLGRYFINTQGVPVWASYDYNPTAVVQPADQGVLPDLVYEVDASAWVTDVTTSLPSGGTWTDSDATGIARSSMDIRHATATDAEARAVASTIVERSTDTPRLKGLTFDLLSLDSGQVSALLALELGSRLTHGGLPPQLPSPQSMVVERIEESLTERSWFLSLITSPAIDMNWFAWGDAWGSKPWKTF